MYDTDKYKNYMSMIPQSWLGKAKAAGLMGMGGIQIGAMGNTDSRPTPDWYPKNFQSPTRTPTIENATIPDWFSYMKPRVGQSRPRTWGVLEEDRNSFVNEEGERELYKDTPPFKFQSIGSDEKGMTKYKIQPYANTPVSYMVQNMGADSMPGWAYTTAGGLQGEGVDEGTTVELPLRTNWKYALGDILRRGKTAVGNLAHIPTTIFGGADNMPIY